MTSLPYYRDAEKGFPQVAGSCPTVRRGSTQPRKFLFVGLSTQTRHSPFDIFSLVRYPKIAGKLLSEFLTEAGIPRLLAVCLSVIDKVLNSQSAQLTHFQRVDAGELRNHLHLAEGEGGNEGAECRHFSGHLEVRGVANEGQKGTRGQLPRGRERGKSTREMRREEKRGEAAKNAVFIQSCRALPQRPPDRRCL